MRILIVSAYFPPHPGGVEVVARNHAGSLAAGGHDVTVATTHTDPATPRRETVDGFTVVRLPARDFFERRAGIPYPLIGPTFCRGLRRLVAECDAVHVHDVLYQPSQLAAVLARLAGKPLFATQNIGPVHHPRRLVRGVERFTRATAGRYVWRHARRITAHNPLVYQHLRAQGVPADRIVTTPNGIDTTVFRPGPVRDAQRRRARLGVPVGQPMVLFVGRLIGQKGLPALLAAVGPEYRIVVVGAGTPPERGVRGVTFAGPLARHDLVDLYRLADVFVLPATGEVFPLAIQEAMACGVPVITTDDPRYDDLGVDRRLLRLVPAEPDALRAAVLAVLADPHLGGEMADYGRRYATARFEWRHNQKPLLAMYDGT